MRFFNIENFPRSARFSLASRISDCALNVMEHIVEAIYSRNRFHILSRVNLNLEKLRVFYRIAKDRQYLSIRQYEFIASSIDEAGRMTGGWQKHGQTGRKSF